MCWFVRKLSQTSTLRRSEYNSILEEQSKRFLSDFPGNDPVAARKRIEEEIMRSRIDNFEVDRVLHRMKLS
jgi:hypothetical protein